MKLLLLLLVGVFLSANDSFEEFMQKMKEKTAEYKDQNSSKSEVKRIEEKYNIPSREEVLSKHKKLLHQLDSKGKKIAQKSFQTLPKMQNVKMKDLNISNNQDKKVDTIFYLFSTSQSEYMFYNFVEESSKLKKVNKNIKYYGVVQGMLSKKQLQKLYTPFKYNKELEDDAVIKMQPFIFKDLDLKRVPVYLFSKCSMSEFKYKDCENKYIVRGEISLKKALDVVSKNDKSYLKYLNILEKGDY